MTSTVILSGLVFCFFLLFFFVNFFAMAAEGICERKNTYWLLVICRPYNAKKTSCNQLSIKQLKLRLCGCLMRG